MTGNLTKRAVILGNPDEQPALSLKDYRHLKGITMANTIASELAEVLQLAALDARFDFEARIRVRPTEFRQLESLGRGVAGVAFVDYEILLDDSVGARHSEAGVIPIPEGR